MSTLTNLLLFFPLLLASPCLGAQGGSDSVRLLDESLVAEDGLIFDGKKGVDYQFGPQISAHGDCIAVVNGFTFVTWYRGGMDKRNLMLSRRRNGDPAAPWVTLEFPDRHIGYRGDSTLGDSHNTAAVAVSLLDSTVHLLYDMHAYDTLNFPDHYFNYRITERGAAFLPDEDFTLERFHPKRNYLVAGQSYERTTYPGFLSDPAGRLIVGYRLGGSGNGEHQYAVYDGNGWSKTLSWANGQNLGPDNYSVYGSMKILHGRLHAGYSIRYRNGEKYALNSGLYYAYALPPYGPGDWYDLAGDPLDLPIRKTDHLQLADPEGDYGTADRPRTSNGPNFTVTEDGSLHFITRVDGRTVHYWRPAGTDAFQSAEGGEIPTGGTLFSFGNTLLTVDLDEGFTRLKTAKAGTNDWRTVYEKRGGTQFRHFRAETAGDRLFVYLMERAEGDARPLYLQVYDVSAAVGSDANGRSEGSY